MKRSDAIDLDLRLRRLVGRPIVWIALVGALFGAPLLRGLLSGRAPPPPPILGILPRFDLLDDRGRRLSSDSIRGHAFIANLLCTDCGADGAVAAETMRKLQHRSRNLGDSLWLVSFSPEGNASALGAVRRMHPSSERWFLAAGAPAPLRALFSEGAVLLLIDRQLRIRGRYGAAPGDLDEALRDASLVLSIE